MAYGTHMFPKFSSRNQSPAAGRIAHKYNDDITCWRQCVCESSKEWWKHGAPGWLSGLSVELWLSSWSNSWWVRAPCGLCADSSEPGACFRFCVSLSLPLPHLRSVSLSKINIKKNLKKRKRKRNDLHKFLESHHVFELEQNKKSIIWRY